MLEAQRHAKEVHDRLRSPSNAVEDNGIDLKRKPKAIPIAQLDQAQNVPVTEPFLLPILSAGNLENICEPISIRKIQRMICRHYQVTRYDMLSKRRPANVCWPRQIAMYLAKTMTLKSYPHIGREFGGKDHTTIIHAVRKVEQKMSEDPLIKDAVETLERIIRGDPDVICET